MTLSEGQSGNNPEPSDGMERSQGLGPVSTPFTCSKSRIPHSRGWGGYTGTRRPEAALHAISISPPQTLSVLRVRADLNFGGIGPQPSHCAPEINTALASDVPPSPCRVPVCRLDVSPRPLGRVLQVRLGLSRAGRHRMFDQKLRTNILKVLG